MKGLLTKEFYNLRYYVLLFLCIEILYFLSFLGTFIGTETTGEINYETININIMVTFISLGFILIWFPTNLITSSHQLDARCHFNSFILTSGISRKKVYFSKYVTSLILNILPISLYVIGIILCYTVYPHRDLLAENIWLPLIFIGISSMLFMTSLTNFFFTIFDAIKLAFLTIIISMLGYAVTVLAMVFGYEFMMYDQIAGILITFLVTALLIIGSLLFTYFGYRLFKKKEF